jgi:hypothetical protein
MLNNKIKSVFYDHFSNLYSCSRVWSAWSYDTMSESDFIAINEDVDIMSEIIESILQLQEINIDSVISILENYTDIYYNENISEFCQHSFHEDWIDYIILEDFIIDVLPIVCEIKLSKNIKRF